MINFTEWLKHNDIVKQVADTWFRTDGTPKYRSMTETMIIDTMKSYNLNLRDAAKLFEKALLYYKKEHIVGGPQAYWNLVERISKTYII